MGSKEEALFNFNKDPELSPEKKKSRRRTLAGLSFGYFVDQGEDQAISVLFPTLQRLWGLSYTQLGTIGTVRRLLQAISAPFWGYAADKWSRKKIIFFGTGIWGIWTLICGFSQDFGQLLIIRSISGIGLGTLLPATFSLMADTFRPKERGRALGTMEAIGTLGIVVGVLGIGFLATPDLWRYGFFILGTLSVLSGIVVWFFVEEPVRGASEPELENIITEEIAAKYTANWEDIKKVMKIPTMWVAIVQGLAGSMPWVVMGLFLITWMNNDLGFEETQATIAFGSIVIGLAASHFVGGMIGDYAEKVNPKYGRTFIGQFSVLSGVPLSYILFTQAYGWSLTTLVAFCFFTAFMIGWPGKGAKEPMMQGAIPPELRSTAFAVVTFIENGFAAFIALYAGHLGDNIGLQEALLWTIPFPWLICGLLFSLFYWSYPRDSKILREQMAERAIEIKLSIEK